MSGLTELLLALGNPDPSVRLPAEAHVNQARQTDLVAFLYLLLQEFGDESGPPFARHMAGMLLKNSIAPNLRDPVARRSLEREWMALNPEVRGNVKRGVLTTLGSPRKEVQSMAANIIGNLSRIELPAGEWPELMNILLDVAQTGNEQHQEAALTAIGYVCEEGVDSHGVEEALMPYTNRILTIVVQCMASGNSEVCYYATNALCNAMEFIHDNMKHQEQRDLLVDTLCTTAMSSQNVRTREKAMESLVKVADMYYSTLPAYMERLHLITTDAIFKDEEPVGLQAMLFWISICEKENDMHMHDDATCLQYTFKGASIISSISLQALVRQEEDQEEGDWNISIAGGKLLQSLSMCIGDPVVDLVMPFVYRNISSDNWREKEAAVMAFGCILNGPKPETIQDTVAQAVTGLMEYIRNDNRMVADTSGWTLAVVCELFGDVFLYFPQRLQQLMNIISPMIGGGDLMAVRACHILHNLALAYEEEGEMDTNALSPYLRDLFAVLLDAIDKGVNINVKSVAQEALNVLIDAAATDCNQYLDLIVPALHKRMCYMIEAHLQGQMSNTEVMSMLGLLCGSLGSLAKKLRTSFLPHLPESMGIMIQILGSQDNTVLDEALIMLGSFSHAVKNHLCQYIPNVIPYLLNAMERVDEPELATVAVGTLGDLSLNLRKDLSPFIGSFLDLILRKLQNPDVDRDLKCTFIHCLSDIVLNVGNTEFSGHLDVFLQIINIFFEHSCGIDITESDDDEQYVMCLWESISAFYTGVCQSFKSSGEKLAPYLQNMLKFALHVSTLGKNFDYVETFLAAVSVIGDVACVLKSINLPEVRQMGKSAILTPQVWQVMEHAQSVASCEEGSMEQVSWVMDQLRMLEAS